MSEPQQLAGAAAQIAEALRPLTPDSRETAMKMALMMCPPEPVKPPRARRSDAGRSRKAAGRLLECPEVGLLEPREDDPLLEAQS